MNGWKDGKFDPDSVEPDYEFALGNGPEIEDITESMDVMKRSNEGRSTPGVPQPTPKNSLNPEQIHGLRQIALKSLWSMINADSGNLWLNENGMFVIKNGSAIMVVKPEYIEEK
jgi:hypothetical protein